MASSAVTTNSEDRRESTECVGTKDEYTEREGTLRREKGRAKYNLTQARNKLSSILWEPELPSRRTVQDACSSLDTCMDIPMEVITSLSELYSSVKTLRRRERSPRRWTRLLMNTLRQANRLENI